LGTGRTRVFGRGRIGRRHGAVMGGSHRRGAIDRLSRNLVPELTTVEALGPPADEETNGSQAWGGGAGWTARSAFPAQASREGSQGWLMGGGSIGLGQDLAARKDTIFARKVLMDSIGHNMDELEGIAAAQKVDLNEGKEHADIVSVKLMAFPHLFPTATNQWK